ncbi:MAG: NADH-quinone oxidoreductase subunit N [Pseudomonadota bacterium]
MSDLLVVLPDALLFGSLCFLVLVAAFLNSRCILRWASIATVLGYLWSVTYQTHHISELIAIGDAHFKSLFVLDASSLGMKTFAGIVTLLVIIFLESIVFASAPEKAKEGVIIVLFGLLGASIMVGASHYLMSYLGLELLSLALVVLIAWGLETEQLEAAIKYFILSSLASGILLFGVSLIYGATGHLNFVSSALVRYPLYNMYTIGQILIVAGVAFKLGWVPFHFWISDVYASARWYTIVALSSLSKIGIIGFMMRLYDTGVFSSNVIASQFIIVLSILSILIGNILGVQQKSLRRILAYSSIANMGYIGLALVCRTGAPFYLAIYILNTLVMASILFSRFGHALDINLEDIKGFALKHPYQGALLTFTMFSFAGLPITPGFWAKWHVFKGFFAQYSPWFAIFIIIGTLVGTFYYVRIVKYLYEDVDAKDTEINSKITPAISSSFSYGMSLSIVVIALLWSTVAPDALLSWSERITGKGTATLEEAARLPVASPHAVFTTKAIPLKVPTLQKSLNNPLVNPMPPVQ